MRYSFFSLSAIGLILLGTSSLRGEPTEAEQLYRRLHKMGDHKMELYAKRWLALIELQDWTDATGKYRVKAKYLSHDENLESVTLRAVKGKGKDRVEREITVPVAKLSPQAQSRVQRIARFQPRLLEELEAAEQAAIEKEDSDEFRPGVNPEFREEGRPDPPQVPGRRPSDRGNPAPRPPAAGVPPRPGQPAEGPREPGVVQGVENPYGGTQWIGRDQLVTDPRFRNNQQPEFNTPGQPGQRIAQPPPPGQPNLVDDSPWRTSYPELLTRIKVIESDGQSPRIDLTELGLFGQQIELSWTLMQSLANQDVGTMLARSSEVLPEGVVGEVIWEALLVEPPRFPGGVVSLDLPSPPEPVRFQFFADDKLETGNWEQFKPGDRVRFIARLGTPAKKPMINFRIRLPNQVHTMPPGPPAPPYRLGHNIAQPPAPGTEPALPGPASGATAQEPGTVLWEFETGGPVFSSVAIGTDGTLYVGSQDNKVYALDGRTGGKKWEFQTGGEVAASGAIGTDGTLYIGSADNKVYALDGQTGEKKWEFQTGGPVESSGAIGSDGTLYVGSSDSKIYALDGQTGEKKWEFKTGGQITSSGAIGTDGTLYVGSSNGKVYALDGQTGEKKWEFKTGGRVRSSPAIGTNGTLYVGSKDSKVYALDSQTGEKKWEFETGLPVRSSPVIGTDGTLYVGSLDNNVYAIDGQTGEKKWMYETGSQMVSSGAIGTDGTLYVGSWNNYVWALDGQTGERKWLFQTGAPVTSSGVIGTDGTLYVGSNDKKVYAFKTASSGLAKSAWPMRGQNAQNTRRAAAVPTAEVKPAPVAGEKKAQSEPAPPRQQPAESGRFTE